MIAQRVVECSNCGDGRIGTLLAAASLIIAASSLAIALKALLDGRRTAKLHVRFRVIGGDRHGTLRMGGSGGTVRVEIGLSNTGKIAAGPTTLNVLLPYPLGFSWSDANGSPEAGPSDPVRTGETLADPVRGEIDAWFRDKTLPRVGLSEHPCAYVTFNVTLPEGDGPREVLVPIRVVVGADELPKRRDVIEEMVVRVVPE